MTSRLSADTRASTSPPRADADLEQLYTAIRHVHAPSPEQCTRMAAHIDAFAALPPVCATQPTSSGLLANRLVHSMRFVLRKFAGIGGIGGAGLMALGSWLYLHPAPTIPPAPEQKSFVAAASLAADAESESTSFAVVSMVAPTPQLHLDAAPQAATRNPPRAKRPAQPPAQPHNAPPRTAPTPPDAQGPVLAQPASKDAALLHDLAILNRVEAHLRRGRGKDALAILESETLLALEKHGNALRAAAHCQLGDRDAGLWLLRQERTANAASAVFARASTYCGAPLEPR